MKAVYPYLALLTVKGCGINDCLKLPNPPEKAFAMMQSHAGRQELSRLLGKEIVDIDWEAFQKQVDAIKKNGAGVISIRNDDYPDYLRSISMPPPFLFYTGDLTCISKRGVAVVGTRRPSPRGVNFTRELARELSRRGVTVISGLARGIDTAAHEGSLEGGGPTLGILGTGIDVPYPRENSDLMKRVARKGCILSEQIMGVGPMKHTFPLRNRLISAFSHAVVVVEAGERSGALITAEWALEQGREVGAVPGFPGDFRSLGVNSLIKKGAFLVESCEDIMQAAPKLALETPSSAPPKETPEGLNAGLLSALEKEVRINRNELGKVLNVISGDPVDMDTICRFTGLEASRVTGILTALQLVKWIDIDKSGRFYRHAKNRAGTGCKGEFTEHDQT